jgi:hypothetical protein
MTDTDQPIAELPLDDRARAFVRERLLIGGHCRHPAPAVASQTLEFRPIAAC